MSRPSSVSRSATPFSPLRSRCSSPSASTTVTDTVSVLPPSKPMSTRTLSSLAAIAHQLCQHAVGRVGMDERDAHPVEAGPRLVVDQLDAARAQLGELRVEVVDLVRDVVHPRAALGEKPADRRVL